MAEAFAALSAFCFAATHVTSKRGLKDTSIVASLLLMLPVAWLVVLTAVAVDPPESVAASGLVLFVVAGFIAPALSRLAALAGVDRLGPSIAVPIQQGVRPLLVVLGAVVFLSESVGPLRLLGVLAIIAGGWQLSRSPDRTNTPAGTTADPKTQERSVRLRIRSRLRPGIGFPILAALSYASSDVIVKKGLETVPDPSFAAAVNIGTALVAWAVAVALFQPVREKIHFGAGYRWLLLAGIFQGFAILSLLFALREGELSVVGPIVAAQPLVVLLFSLLLLRDIERIERSTVLAGTLIVVGAILVIR